jgi:SprT protein
MTQVPAHLKARLEQKVLECVLKASKHFGRNYTTPYIRYDVRGRVGGYAHGTEFINLNPILLMENVEEYVNQVVPHEIAHCIDTANGDNRRTGGIVFTRSGKMRRSKRSIHGPSWRAIMHVFGCDADRTHNMDTSNAQVKTKTKYEYKCRACNKAIFVSSVRHNKQQRSLMLYGRGEYWCAKCGPDGQLEFVANRGKVSFDQARQAALQPKPSYPPVPVASQYDPKPEVSNVNRARKLYGMYGMLGRGVFIRKCVEAGLKETTASTYYQNFRSGK